MKRTIMEVWRDVISAIQVLATTADGKKVVEAT